jgi:hypothetical protein
MIKGNIKILDSDAVIQKNLLDSMQSALKLLFNKARPKIESDVKAVIVDALSVCPEILSLKSGKLKYDFGLSSDPADDIIYAVANSTYVSFRNFSLKLNGTSVAFNIFIQPSDFQNLLSLDLASVTTEKGESLPWLSWLLTAGDAIIIDSYSVKYDTANPKSRSGGAIMIPNGFFKVDSSFSGTEDDNFITRALNRYQNRIIESVEKNL